MAVRIAGVNIPEQKHIWVGLRAIYGLGPSLSRKICQDAGVKPEIKVKELSESDLDLLRQEVSRYTVEGDLRRERAMNIKHKIDLGCYAGIRHRRGLPVHGQRTRTNAKTRKGRKKSS